MHARRSIPIQVERERAADKVSTRQVRVHVAGEPEAVRREATERNEGLRRSDTALRRHTLQFHAHRQARDSSEVGQYRSSGSS